VLAKTLQTFGEELAEQTPAPGGGAVSAVAVGMAAGLVGMGGRFSDDYLEEAFDLADKADVVRAHVLPLAQADAEAYEALLAARRIPRDDEDRDEAIAEAALEAARIPLEISAFAAEVGLMADRLASRGNPNLRGDVITAALIAAAAARACATLVRINLDESAEEFRQASEHSRAAEAAAGRALSSLL
jgi:methenyltetrahydrofolate cyclohydrolase